MRNLAFTSDSPQSIKLGDSNDALSLKVTELDKPVDLSKVSSITVKIGNTAGYLTEINVDVSSLLHPTDGIIDVVISSKVSSELPAGDYLLEVWIDDAQGNTVIYPDSSYPTVIGFSIKKNIMTATSTAITTLTLADFEAKFDEMQEDLQYKAASGYFKGDTGPQGPTGPQGAKGDKGDKGDTGTVDNTGLTNAPAFVALQTQVDNSAVGTNLLLNSRGKFQSHRSVIDNSSLYGSSNVHMTQGQQYTVHADASSGLVWSGTHDPSVESNNVVLWLTDGETVFTIISDANTGTGTTFTWNNPSGIYYIRLNTYKTDNSGYIENVKIEKGSVATDWCPNPSEILTQSDYAKIKAAIVALGGSLS